MPAEDKTSNRFFIAIGAKEFHNKKYCANLFSMISNQNKMLIAYGLNMTLFCGVAVYFIQKNMAQNKALISTMSALKSRIVYADFIHSKQLSENLVAKDSSTPLHDLFWPPLTIHIPMAITRASAIEQNIQLKNILNWPENLNTSTISYFLSLGTNNQAYVSTTGTAVKEKVQTPLLYTFQINTAELNELANKLSLYYNFVEYNQNTPPLAILTNLNSKNVDTLTTRFTSPQFTNNSLDSSTKTITLSGEKYSFIGTPLFTSSDPWIQQVLYSVIPVHNYRAIDRASIVLLVWTFFCTSIGIFILGYAQSS